MRKVLYLNKLHQISSYWIICLVEKDWEVPTKTHHLLLISLERESQNFWELTSGPFKWWQNKYTFQLSCGAITPNRYSDERWVLIFWESSKFYSIGLLIIFWSVSQILSEGFAFPREKFTQALAHNKSCWANWYRTLKQFIKWSIEDLSERFEPSVLTLGAYEKNFIKIWPLRALLLFYLWTLLVVPSKFEENFVLQA